MPAGAVPVKRVIYGAGGHGVGGTFVSGNSAYTP
jgi:hypothetical protein